MSRRILDELWISEEDVKKYKTEEVKLRYRSFVRFGKKVGRVNTHKKNTPWRYYNVIYWWTDKQLHETVNNIESEDERRSLCKHIIRLEYATRLATKRKEVAYMDAREIIGIIERMWYTVTKNHIHSWHKKLNPEQARNKKLLSIEQENANKQ